MFSPLAKNWRIASMVKHHRFATQKRQPLGSARDHRARQQRKQAPNRVPAFFVG